MIMWVQRCKVPIPWLQRPQCCKHCLFSTGLSPTWSIWSHICHCNDKAPLGSIFGAVCGGHVADFMAHRLPRRQLAVHRWYRPHKTHWYCDTSVACPPFISFKIFWFSTTAVKAMVLCRVGSDTAFYLDNSLQGFQSRCESSFFGLTAQCT